MIRKPRTEKNFAPDSESAGTAAACLARIFKKVEIDGLSENATGELADDINAISNKFSICPKGSVLLGAIMEKTNSSNSCDEEDLANYIGCTNIEFFEFHDALRELLDKDIVVKASGRRSSFVATPEAMRAVEKDTVFVPVKTSGLTTEELFTRFRKLIADFRNSNIDEERLHESMIRLVERNDQLLFCRKMAGSPLFTQECTDTERRMFFYLCHRYVSKGDQSVPLDILMNFIEFMEDDQMLRRHFANGTTNLQKEGLVTFGNEDGFVETDKISLADYVKNDSHPGRRSTTRASSGARTSRSRNSSTTLPRRSRSGDWPNFWRTKTSARCRKGSSPRVCRRESAACSTEAQAPARPHR